MGHNLQHNTDNDAVMFSSSTTIKAMATLYSLEKNKRGVIIATGLAQYMHL